MRTPVLLPLLGLLLSATASAWASGPYVVTVKTPKGGTISPSGAVTVQEGDTQPFTITPNEGYHIVSVTVDGVNKGVVTSVTAPADLNLSAKKHSISAKFAINSYNVTAMAGAGGTIKPLGTKVVKHGKTAKYTITASKDHRIARLLINGEDALVNKAPSDVYTLFTVISAETIIEATFLDMSPAGKAVDNDGDGYSENQQDCDDANGDIHPNAPEVCGDGIDQDCDNADCDSNADSLPLMRALSIGGNWGANMDGIKNIQDEFIQRLLANNVNWVGIKLPVFSESISDPEIKIRYRPADAGPIGYYSFNDTDIINAITKFKQHGIDVFLSLVIMPPQQDRSSTCRTPNYAVDYHLFGDTLVPRASTSGAWDSQCIDPALWWWSPSHPDHAKNVAKFWDSYTKVAVKYATLAQQLGVGMFSLGEESERLFRTRATARFPNHFRNELTQMVSEVRKVYSGLLTYGQTVFVYLDHPEWWDYDYAASSSLFADIGLDVIGLSGCSTYLQRPEQVRVYSVSELETAWSAFFQKYLVPLRDKNHDMPIIFSDIGVTNSIHVPWEPLAEQGSLIYYFDLNNNGIEDGDEQQANFYQALFNVNKYNNYLARGIVLVDYMIDSLPHIFAYSLARRNLELHGRLAEKVIAEEYASW